jgi:hypothetical protein
MKHESIIAMFCLIAFATLPTSVIAATSGNDGAVASASVTASEIVWQPKVEYSSIVLTVSTPGGEVLRSEFAAGTSPSFRSTDERGQTRPDGQYIYEMRVVPVLAPATREALAAAREKGSGDEMMREMKGSGLVPKEPIVQSGAFRIFQGAIVMGGATEGGKTPVPPKKTIGLNLMRPRSASSGYRLTPVLMTSRNTFATGSGFRPFDQVIADDLIVNGSICAGQDCDNNENFGADTLRLKENNLRIKFEDTSNTGSFPSTDWQLTANDQIIGGANKFSIEDITDAKVPFTVMGNAPNNSIFVDDSGRLGRNTSTPVLDIHTVNSNTPALRLEQSSAGGFQAQTWDVAGNETVFFVRDVTNGSRLPFKIQPGAANNSLVITSNGNVGVGTLTPEQKLHVFGNLVVEGSIDVRDNQFGLNLSPVDTGNVLERLAKVSLFKSGSSDKSAGSHLTLNVKELNAAFGLGNRDRISLMDFNTISLAAIKAAYAKLQEKDAEISSLQKENVALQNQLGELQRRVQAVESFLLLASQQQKK